MNFCILYTPRLALILVDLSLDIYKKSHSTTLVSTASKGGGILYDSCYLFFFLILAEEVLVLGVSIKGMKNFISFMFKLKSPVVHNKSISDI